MQLKECFPMGKKVFMLGAGQVLINNFHTVGRTRISIPLVFVIDLFLHGQNVILPAGCLRCCPANKSELFDC